LKLAEALRLQFLKSLTRAGREEPTDALANFADAVGRVMRAANPRLLLPAAAVMMRRRALTASAAGRMDEQSRSEIAIFKAFLAASGLDVDESSIQKRPPPEPDLHCVIHGLGRAAFELVEIIDSGLAQMVNDQIRVERALAAGVARMQPTDRVAISQQLADALVFVDYSQSTARQKERAIPGLLTFLRHLPAGFEGDIRVTPPLEVELVRSIRVTRGDYPPGPHFQVSAVRSIADPVLDRIKTKWSKMYQTPARRELLAFYLLHPAHPPDFWLEELTAFVIAQRKPASFERVWVFDASQQEVLAVVSTSSGSAAQPRCEPTLALEGTLRRTRGSPRNVGRDKRRSVE
jgi:hypothetical protein